MVACNAIRPVAVMIFSSLIAVSRRACAYLHQLHLTVGTLLIAVQTRVPAAMMRKMSRYILSRNEEKVASKPTVILLNVHRENFLIFC
jgi:hypothetical protein